MLVRSKDRPPSSDPILSCSLPKIKWLSQADIAAAKGWGTSGTPLGEPDTDAVLRFSLQKGKDDAMAAPWALPSINAARYGSHEDADDPVGRVGAANSPFIGPRIVQCA